MSENDGVELLNLFESLEIKNKNQEVFFVNKLKEFISQHNDLQEKTVGLELFIENKLRAKNGPVESVTTTSNIGQDNQPKPIIVDNQFSEIEDSNSIGYLRHQLQELELNKSQQLKERDNRVATLETRVKELWRLAEKHKKQLENQVELSATLQTELQASYKENESLAREMEMLNLMFAELEENIVNQESSLTTDIDLKALEGLDASVNVSNGRVTSDNDELFRTEGSHKVISISKTFIKLKTLILEKKSLEGQLSKMKNVYKHLCSQVNIHEEKLCNITDELNSTWFYVSKIKEQHKKLHSSEQILRAELAEKRQLLTKLRTELEESRQSMNEVKLKTAESERQWIALKADFAQQKKMLFEDEDSEKSKENSIVDCDIPDEELENMEIPDPFGDDEPNVLVVDPLEPLVVDHLGVASNMLPIAAISPVAPITPSVVFLPSASFLANVPSQLQPPIFFDRSGEESDEKKKESDDKSQPEEVDENITNLITRLMSSTARGAFLANRLSDIHKRIAAGEPLITNSEEEEDEEGEEDDETATEVEGDDLSENPIATETDSDEIEEIELPDLNNDDNDVDAEPGPSTSARPLLATQISLESIHSDHTEVNSDHASEDIPVEEIIEAVENNDTGIKARIEPLLALYQQQYMMQESSDSAASPSDMSEDDHESYEIPPPPPPPPYSLAPPVPTMSVRPMYNSHLSDEDSDDSYTERRRTRSTQSPESSTAVTRDLEFAQSDQQNIMLELERRLKESEKLSKQLSVQSGPPLCQAFSIIVRTDNKKLIWNITNNNEVPPAIWTTYQPLGDDEGHPEVLPSHVTKVTTHDCTALITTLETFCAYSGLYTLHTEGRNTGKVTVKLDMIEHILIEDH